MLIEVAGPYYDDNTGKTVDPDLCRVLLSRHKLAEGGRQVIGHCRPSNKSVLIFPYLDLSDRERDEAIQWVTEILSDDYKRWPDNRADIGSRGPAS